MSGTTKKPVSMKQGASDDFQTPPEALRPLYPFLPRDWTIWEPACGQGNLVRAFEEHGYRTIGSDIKQQRDYLLWEPTETWDCAVTNPPFAFKQEFLARAYALGKPFAFLLPLTTFETEKRQSLFRRFGLEVVLFPYRIDFTPPSGKGSSAWFSTAWFTYGLNIGRELTFWQPETGQRSLL